MTSPGTGKWHPERPKWHPERRRWQPDQNEPHTTAQRLRCVFIVKNYDFTAFYDVFSRKMQKIVKFCIFQKPTGVLILKRTTHFVSSFGWGGLSGFVQCRRPGVVWGGHARPGRETGALGGGSVQWQKAEKVEIRRLAHVRVARKPPGSHSERK